MIRLSEILHTIKAENEQGLTEIDRWNILHAEYLENMDFKPDGIHYYTLTKPRIRVCHKKNEGFVVDDGAHQKRYLFKKFKQLEEFFTNYKQKWEDAPETGTPEEDDQEESESEQ